MGHSAEARLADNTGTLEAQSDLSWEELQEEQRLAATDNIYD